MRFWLPLPGELPSFVDLVSALFTKLLKVGGENLTDNVLQLLCCAGCVCRKRRERKHQPECAMIAKTLEPDY